MAFNLKYPIRGYMVQFGRNATDVISVKILYGIFSGEYMLA